MTEGSAFTDTGTFMGVPGRAEVGAAKAAVLGIPFDCGVHPTRIGARLGPRAIREQSALVRPHLPPMHDWDPLARLGLVDCGDVDLVPGRPEPALPLIEAAVGRIVEAGAIPVTMGGDGLVTLPQLRALHRRYPELVVLHIDAHTDTYPDEDGLEPYNTGSTFTRAAEEGVVDVAHSIHVGPRGSTRPGGVFEHTREVGYELIDGADYVRRGPAEVLAHIHARLTGRPVYLCFDMDFFDPSCAPGVCTPTWGGASAGEGLSLLLGLSGLDLVAFDVNTVSPPHDVGGMTAFLAATVMHHCLFLACVALGLDNVGAGET
jgi:agmatinase